ncbi:MAG: phosphomannomutase/phosphoglucomutase [Eubacterium sp.]|nr:phosphomannomutase/phosphoglucomutase [Eubacterium sp.]
MNIENITSLQNGSDIRGIAMEGVKGEHVTLTQDMTMKIAYAFSAWLKAKLGTDRLAVAVGRDSRLTGQHLAQAACMGLVSDGNQVYDCGIATTPAMFMTTLDPEMNCDGAIMITASHLPFNRNGIKLFTKEGGLNKEDIAEILASAETIATEFKAGGKREDYAFIPKYAANIVKMIQDKTQMEKPLAGSKIIVDAGNGAGGFFAKLVLEPLGADTEGSQFLEPDGNFPNHIPNPEDAGAIEAITSAVIKHKADMGIIFDTDVDRAAIIDEQGHAINRNGFIAFIASILLAEYPGSTIVTDSVTSTGLTEYIEGLGGKHHRFKRGYKNVINEAIRLNAEGTETHLAMETSGHGAIKENYFLDDGAYLVTMALIKFAQLHKEGKPISDFLKGLKEPAEATEVRYHIEAPDFKTFGAGVLEAFKKYAEAQEGWSLVEPNYEGIRVACGDDAGKGWCLMRMSLHDPIIPLNIESDEVGGCGKIQKIIDKFLKDFPELKR